MNDPFEPRDRELWRIEVYDRKTGEVVNSFKPLPQNRADKLETAVYGQINTKLYDTRQVRA